MCAGASEYRAIAQQLRGSCGSAGASSRSWRERAMAHFRQLTVFHFAPIVSFWDTGVSTLGGA